MATYKFGQPAPKPAAKPATKAAAKAPKAAQQAPAKQFGQPAPKTMPKPATQPSKPVANASKTKNVSKAGNAAKPAVSNAGMAVSLRLPGGGTLNQPAAKNSAATQTANQPAGRYDDVPGTIGIGFTSMNAYEKRMADLSAKAAKQFGQPAPKTMPKPATQPPKPAANSNTGTGGSKNNSKAGGSKNNSKAGGSKDNSKAGAPKNFTSGAAIGAFTPSVSANAMPEYQQRFGYNLINNASNLANRDYVPYNPQITAGLNEQQQQAYQDIKANQDSWSPELNFASSGLQNQATQGTADELQQQQEQYLQPNRVQQNLNAGEQSWQKAGALNSMAESDPYFDQAGALNMVSAASPSLDKAGRIDMTAAANPYMSQSADATAQSLSERAMAAANPYMTAASQSAASGISQYSNPYQQSVLDTIAKQGARNLSENLLPGVSDAFIRAGQFGGNRMGEFGSRALRDTQEAVLQQQSQAAQAGYTQALQASQEDRNRQLNLANTAGNISGADLSRTLQGAQQYGQLGQTAGQLAGQQMQNLTNLGQTYGQMTGQQAQNMTNLGQSVGNMANQQAQTYANLGQMQTAAGQAQQGYGLNAAGQYQDALSGDYSRQMNAYNQVGALGQMRSALNASDAAQMEAAGQAQTNYQQALNNENYGKFQQAQDAPWVANERARNLVQGTAVPTYTTSNQFNVSGYSPSPYAATMGGLSYAAAVGQQPQYAYSQQGQQP